jgi:hypothetical protein
MSVLLFHHPSSRLARASTDPDITHELHRTAAALILLAEAASPGALASALGQAMGEAVEPLLGAYTYLVLASLEYPSINSQAGYEQPDAARGALMSVALPLMARTAALAFRASADALLVPDAARAAAGEGDERMLRAVVRLVQSVLLLGTAATTSTSASRRGSGAASTVQLDAFWARVWPDWERMLGMSVEGTCLNTVSCM